MKSKSLQKFSLAFSAVAASVFLLNACQQDEDPAAGFGLSTGNSITVNALAGADTTLNVVVTSPLEWTVESKPEWVSLTPEGSDGSPMLVKTKILHNESIDYRQGDIVFKLSNGATYPISCTQFGTGGNLVIQGATSFPLTYEIQSVSSAVASNLKNLTTEILPATASSWLGAVMTPGASIYEYSCDINTKTTNETIEDRKAKVVIIGETNDRLMADTIYVTQKYKMETFAGSVTNDATAFKVDWTPSANAQIAYYTLTVTDGKDTPATLASYNVSGKTSALIDTMAFMKNNTYFGVLAITVSGKASAESASILGETITQQAHSHFANYTGAGTAASPYEINCARHFNNIMVVFGIYGRSGKVSGDLTTMKLNFKQTADITFPAPTNGTDIGGNVSIVGSKADWFMGTYDGGNYKFQNVYIISSAAYVGIFGQLGDGTEDGAKATVKNMNVYVNYIEGRASTWGNTAQAAAVGGIVGVNMGQILDCTVNKYGSDAAVYGNNRTVSGAGQDVANYYAYTGGIAGVSERDIYRCKNLGCPVVSRYIAAGIAGGINNSPLIGKVHGNIQNCYNLADVYMGNPGPGVSLPMGITIEPETVAYADIMGAAGIMGTSIGTGNNRVNLLYCYNGGTIRTENSAGGVMGRVHFATTKYCYNYGNITVVRNTTTTVTKYAGGVVNWANANQNETSVCYNVGTISYVDAVTGDDVGKNIYIGGCVGGKGGSQTNSKLADLVCLAQSTYTGGAATNDGVWGYQANTDYSGITRATCYTLTDDKMKSLSNYTAAFTSTDWEIKAGYAYPQLKATPMP